MSQKLDWSKAKKQREEIPAPELPKSAKQWLGMHAMTEFKKGTKRKRIVKKASKRP